MKPAVKEKNRKKIRDKKAFFDKSQYTVSQSKKRQRFATLSSEDSWIPYHMALDCLLHELAHNDHSNHSAEFYDLWVNLLRWLSF